MCGPIEILLFWDITCLAITRQIVSPIFPQNKAPKVKEGHLKTLRARSVGHFGQRVDESPMHEDDFGVSQSPVSLRCTYNQDLKRP